MVAATDIQPARRGHASLEVDLVADESAVTSAYATAPLKLLTPRARDRSVWAYTSSFGGGFVAGDVTQLHLRIGAGARCFLGTQASTKVYRNPEALACGHVSLATVEAGATLVFAPDPVQAFANSGYEQRQEFHLAPGAGLALVDWFSSGRAARGERWAFRNFYSRNEVFLDGERVFLDAARLDREDGPLNAPHRTGRFNCIALVLLRGEPMREAAKRLLEDVGARAVERRGSLVTSASPSGEGALLRIAGEQVEDVGREIRRHLALLADLLGDDPWARKW